MSQLRTRRFQSSDEVPLNHLYNRMIGAMRFGRVRSLDLMRWIWCQAPGGPVDSWVIEAEEPDGEWKVVGHHGLCPVRFTLNDQDLLCAKTTSTMLLPEFRSKFLYLRFEQECLTQADARFDATYSYAPGTTRLRKPLGYAGGSIWMHFVRGVQTPESISRIVGHLASRHPRKAWDIAGHSLAVFSSPAARQLPLQLVEYTSAEAIGSSFFHSFWDEARRFAGISPRRDVADLAWRFWQRPGSTYATLVHEAETWRAYAIVNLTDPQVLRLEDIFLVPPRPELLDTFLSALFTWCARRGALMLRFSTTRDGQPAGFIDVLLSKMFLSPLRCFRRAMELPRRLSPRGKKKIRDSNSGWNVTNLLLPG